MAPRRQPKSLFLNCVERSVILISKTCYYIEKSNSTLKFSEIEQKVIKLRHQLMSMLPARLFDVLCSHRTCFLYRGDPRLQLHALMHPNMTYFRKSDFDNTTPEKFWVSTLSNLKQLVVLDLKFICTDEILEVIGENCPLLEEINIVSKVGVCKSLFNASVLIRHVSDTGLGFVTNLKHLRILAMDPPRNERANRIGRCVSQAGIIMCISKLPYLEELRIESCDIGSTLITSTIDIGPLSLRKINCHFASADGVRKLMKICPFLRELSITHLSEFSKDLILEQIYTSDVRLYRLDLSFFSFSHSMLQLLQVKGTYLTHFSLWEIDHSMSLNSLLWLGKHCPNLNTLCLMTQTNNLVIPRFFQRPENIFSELRNLTLGNDNFNIHDILTFFFDCTDNMEKLVLKYQKRTRIDDTLTQLLEKGRLKNINVLWFDCTLIISKTIIEKIIHMCDKLNLFTVNYSVNMVELIHYIQDNNLDLKIGTY